MATTIQQVTDAVVAKLRALSGIKFAPDEPAEQMTAFPFAVVWWSEGDANPVDATWGYTLDTVIAEIHVARKGLPYDVAAVRGFGDTARAALVADPTLGGVTNSLNRLYMSFRAMEWGGVQTLGYHLELTYKFTVL